MVVERYGQIEIHTSVWSGKRWISKSSLDWILGKESRSPFVNVKNYCLVSAEDMMDELALNFTEYHNDRARVAIAYAGKVAARALSSEVSGKKSDVSFTAKGLYETVKDIKLTKRCRLKRLAEKQTENSIAAELKTREGGHGEITILTGRVDLLTQSEVIEVKCVGNWKHAIGQAVVYQLSYPEKKPRIHLFGKSNANQKRIILEACRKLSITVTFED